MGDHKCSVYCVTASFTPGLGGLLGSRLNFVVLHCLQERFVQTTLCTACQMFAFRRFRTVPLCQSGKRCVQADPGTLKLISIACHLPGKSDIFCCLILSVSLLTQANQSEGLSSRQDGTKLCCLQDLDFTGATSATVMQNTFQNWHTVITQVD